MRWTLICPETDPSPERFARVAQEQNTKPGYSGSQTDRSGPREQRPFATKSSHEPQVARFRPNGSTARC